MAGHIRKKYDDQIQECFGLNLMLYLCRCIKILYVWIFEIVLSGKVNNQVLR